MTYYDWREEVWPAYKQGWPWETHIWGDREQRKAIRTYLRIVWLEHNEARVGKVDTCREGVEREKNEILTWWWNNRSPYFDQYMDFSKRDFGQWLLEQYEDAMKIDYPKNRKKARNE